jgi:hypothetical protein
MGELAVSPSTLCDHDVRGFAPSEITKGISCAVGNQQSATARAHAFESYMTIDIGKVLPP